MSVKNSKGASQSPQSAKPVAKAQKKGAKPAKKK